MTVNWNTIRIHQGAQDQGFEELCCQLFHNEPPASAVAFERRGYRDAGLECAHILRDGGLHGMQAKFFTRAPSADEWGQVDRSVKTALAKNTSLRKLTICIPQNFDDPKIEGQKSAMDRWKEHKTAWETLATGSGMKVEFELWDDTQLTTRLVRPENRGRLRYFFNQEELGPEWFRSRTEAVADDAKPRYTAELNVELPIAQLFDGLGRIERFAVAPRKEQGRLAQSLYYLQRSKDDPRIAAEVEEVARLAQDLVELLAPADFRGVAELPLEGIAAAASALRERVHQARSVLEELDRADEAEKRQEWESAGKEGYFYHPRTYGDQRNQLWDMAEAAHWLAGFAGSRETCLANHPALLVSAKAGKGKTHLFVDVALHRAELGLPTILLLGENFRDADPLSQVIDLVGLQLDRDTFLQALEAAAEASGGKALIMIDALNEGEGLSLWRKRLAGFLRTLRNHPWIGVALSVRTTYEDSVIPEGASESLVRAEHDGFASRPEEAARAFFTYYGIDLPRIPLLHPELSDPLFLKLLCKGLQAAGMRDLPDGYAGVTHVFEFVIDATERKLRLEGRLNAPPHRRLVRECLDRLADELVEQGTDAVPFERALEISNELHPASGYRGSLLEMLISEGVLSTEMMAGEQPTEGVTVAYQRFRDHERARRLLDMHCVPESLDAAFAPDGAIGMRYAEPAGFYRDRGLLETLFVQVPERFGREVVDLLALAGDKFSYVREVVLGNCLIESLLWRRKEAITEATFDALRRTARTQRHYDSYLEVLLALAPVPDHPLNAERLNSLLGRLPIPERDEVWTIWLHQHQGEESGADRLITWACLDEEKNHLDDEAVLLASIALAWLTTSTVRTIRDRATKGMVRLLGPRPHLVPRLLDRFASCDDPYVTERLYAAAYGVALRNYQPEILAILAEDMHTRLFAQETVLADVMVRDYARCVVERAVASGCALSFDVEKARPPYGSSLPPDPPTREHFEGLVSPVGEWTDRDRAISHVVNRFGSFDVSEYAGGPSLKESAFTTVPLGEKVPPSRRQVLKKWEASLNEEQRGLLTAVRRLRYAGVRILVMPPFTNEEADTPSEAGSPEVSNGAEGAGGETSNGANVDEAYARLITELEATLSTEQLRVLREVELNRPEREEAQLPGLAPELLARWVSQRALELGWEADRFAGFDASIERARSGGRDIGPCDTMGAKYLWIAYYEVLARIADNYHAFAGYTREEACQFDGSWQLSLRTIDPSYVPSWRSEEAGRPPKDAWWLRRGYDINAGMFPPADWLRREEDLPDPTKHLVIRGPGGTEWIVLESYPRYSQEPSPDGTLQKRPRRSVWVHLRGYLVRRDKADAMFAWMSDRDFMGGWMPESADLHGIFLGEIYDSLAWAAWDAQAARGDWEDPGNDCPAPVAVVATDFSHIKDDTSLRGASRILVPSRLLVQETGLHWDGVDAQWRSEDGTLVAQDPGARDGNGGLLLVERRFLDRFLEEKGYSLVWTVLGTKLVYDWDDRYPRLEFTGAVLYGRGDLQARITARFFDNDTEDDE